MKRSWSVAPNPVREVAPAPRTSGGPAVAAAPVARLAETASVAAGTLMRWLLAAARASDRVMDWPSACAPATNKASAMVDFKGVTSQRDRGRASSDRLTRLREEGTRRGTGTTGSGGSRGRAPFKMNRRGVKLAGVDKDQHRTNDGSGNHRLPRLERGRCGFGVRIVARGDHAAVVTIAVARADLGTLVRRLIVERRANDARRAARKLVARRAGVEVDAHQQQRTQQGRDARQPDEPPLAHGFPIIPRLSGLAVADLRPNGWRSRLPARKHRWSPPRQRGTPAPMRTPSGQEKPFPVRAKTRQGHQRSLRATP